MSKNKMTPTPWKINHWGRSDKNGITYNGQIDGIGYYCADGVTEKIYGIRADVDPMEYHIQGSFEGAHIADIPDFIHQDGGTESRANAQAIVSAVNGTYGKGIHPDAVEDLLEALKEMTLFYYMDHSGVLPTEKKILSAAKAAIEKAAIK